MINKDNKKENCSLYFEMTSVNDDKNITLMRWVEVEVEKLNIYDASICLEAQRHLNN